jgi:hypothetical protein
VVSSLGKATDFGDEDDPKGRMAKLGTVKERRFQDRGMAVTEYRVDLAEVSGTMRMQVRKDSQHGLVVNGLAAVLNSASHGAFADKFFDGLHVHPTSTAADPHTFDRLAIKPSAKGFTVSDAQFQIELPWEPKVEHVPAKNESIIKLSATHGDADFALLIDEVPSTMALSRTGRWLDDLTQRELDGLLKSLADSHPKGDKQNGTSGSSELRVIQIKGDNGVFSENWLIWDRFQHRMYQLTCAQLSCAGIAKSINLVPTKPSR